jgi:hypothetical protein
MNFLASAVFEQEIIQPALCESCGRRKFLVESQGKAGEIRKITVIVTKTSAVAFFPRPYPASTTAQRVVL